MFIDIPAHLNVNAEDINILNAALLAGMYPKVLCIDPGSGGLRTLGNNQPISIVGRSQLVFAQRNS